MKMGAFVQQNLCHRLSHGIHSSLSRGPGCGLLTYIRGHHWSQQQPYAVSLERETMTPVNSCLMLAEPLTRQFVSVGSNKHKQPSWENQRFDNISQLRSCV